jgi:hypothetical protein
VNNNRLKKILMMSSVSAAIHGVGALIAIPTISVIFLAVGVLPGPLPKWATEFETGMAFGIVFPVLFALLGFINAAVLTYLYTSLVPAQNQLHFSAERPRSVLRIMEEEESESLAEASLRVAS